MHSQITEQLTRVAQSAGIQPTSAGSPPRVHAMSSGQIAQGGGVAAPVPAHASGATSGAAVPVSPPTPDDTALAVLADKLRPIPRASTVDAAVAIGKLLLDGVYDGRSPSSWPRRNAAKVSLRALAALLGGELSASKLSRCIGVHEMMRDLGDVVPAQHLPLGHLETVLPLDREGRVRLLNAAHEGGWSRRELFMQVYRAKAPSPSCRGGRPTRPAVIKLLELLARFEAVQGIPSVAEVRSAHDLPPKYLGIVERASEVLTALSARFGDACDRASSQVRARPS